MDVIAGRFVVNCMIEPLKAIEYLEKSSQKRITEVVNYQDGEKHTPLHAAVMSGNRKLIQLLLEAGANPNKVANEFRVTPLLLACHVTNSQFKLDLDLVSLFLRHGADPNIPDLQGSSCLYHSLIKRDYAVSKLLLLIGGRISKVFQRIVIDHLRTSAIRRPWYGYTPSTETIYHNHTNLLITLAREYHVHVSLRHISLAHIKIHNYK